MSAKISITLLILALSGCSLAQLTQQCTANAKSVREAFTCIQAKAILKKDYFKDFAVWQATVATDAERVAMTEVKFVK